MGRRGLAVLICFSDLFLKKFCEKTAKNPEKRIEKILRKKPGKNGKENIKPGDKITIEDVRESFRHAEEVAKQYAPDEDCGVKYDIEDGCMVFDSWEDMGKYYGGLYTIEEVFKW